MNQKLPSFFRLTLEEQMLFAKRLGLMLKSGMPLLSALKMMQLQAGSKASGILVKDLIQAAEEGRFLHLALQKYRRQFGDFAVNIVRVGEVTGTLHESLFYLAEEIKKKKDLRRKVVSALVYPSFIVFATLGITLLLTLYVFPKILPILKNFRGQLPLTTRLLIFIAHLLAAKAWLIILLFSAIAVIFILAKRQSLRFAFLVDWWLLKIPVLGRLFKHYHLANACRTLSVLLASEVRIVEAVNVTAKSSTSLVYKLSLLQLSQKIARGEQLSDFFKEHAKLYPSMASQMVQVGESTGRLSETLMFLSEIYEAEVDELAKNLSAAIEPMLMVFMGLLVGFVALSIISPIYQFTTSLNPYQ